MKTFLGFILSISFFTAEAFELKVRKSKTVRGMERQFLLKTNLQEEVVLDCQSFVQGISIGGQEWGRFLMLEPYECESLYFRMIDSLEKNQKHCIEIDEEIRTDYNCH